MNATTVTALNTFYSKYSQGGVMPTAMPAITIMVFVNATGVFANMTVIAMTIMSRNLRSTANYLLAFQCFFDSLHVLAHFYLAYVLYSGKNFDSLPDCLHVMTGPITGLNFGTILIFFTAFDRLVSLLLPTYHKHINKFFYLSGYLALCAVYNAYILWLAYTNAAENSQAQVVCLIVEGMHGTPSNIWSMTAFVFVGSAVVVYVVVGVCIRFKVHASTTTKKLYKSLVILCGLYLCSWVFTTLSMVLCAALQLPEETSFFVPLYTGITINIACASNLFVLTRYSSEYKTASHEFLVRLGFKRLAPKTASRIQDKSSTKFTASTTRNTHF